MEKNHPFFILSSHQRLFLPFPSTFCPPPNFLFPHVPFSSHLSLTYIYIYFFNPYSTSLFLLPPFLLSSLLPQHLIPLNLILSFPSFSPHPTLLPRTATSTAATTTSAAAASPVTTLPAQQHMVCNIASRGCGSCEGSVSVI